MASKRISNQQINGTHEDSHAQLPHYCEDLVKSNPGTTAFVERSEGNKFKRIFVSFGASAQGVQFCIPIIGLDGTHLKDKYLGILIATTVVDSHSNLYPLAFAVVDAENDANWLWFLKTLQKFVLETYTPNLLNNGKLVLLLDRQKGLIEGVETVFPEVAYGYCLHHLEENFHK